MSHEFNPPSGSFVTFDSAEHCPGGVFADLDEGSWYKVTGFSQQTGAGGLPLYDVFAQAISTTRLNSSVYVVPTTPAIPATTNGWRGELDWATCELIHLQDDKGNEVWGSGNISRWPWGAPSARISNNLVKTTGVVDIAGGPNTLVTFTGNQVLGSSVVSIADQQYTITNNVFGGTTTVTITNPFMGGPFQVHRNIFNGTSSLLSVSGVDAALSDVFTTRCNDNIVNHSTIRLGGSRMGVIENYINQSTVSVQGMSDTTDTGVFRNIINYSTVTFNSTFNAIMSPVLFEGNTLNRATFTAGGVKNARWLVSNNWIGELAVITLTATQGLFDLVRNTINGSVTVANAGSLIIEDNSLDGTVSWTATNGGVSDSLRFSRVSHNSTVSVSHTSAVNSTVLDTILVGQSTLTMNPGGSVTNTFISDGSLDTAGFTANSCKLENDTSTLVANVNDAQKVTYPNALP